jgi:D-alanyl-D-alanine carboxypeptidase/D-alanyl-D-alanine-endopeptidase (penicillin-binding protein 4)
VAGHAHVKTGYLNEARAIAGYVQAMSGKRYVVVCLVNHPNAARAVEAQDLLLKWVYENG